MKSSRRLKRILSAVLVAGVLVFSACGSPDTVPSSANDEHSQVIQEWAGKGSVTTEPFTIDSGPWIVEWKHVPSQLKGKSVGSLQIIVWNEEESSRPVTIAANSMVEETGTSRINEAGTFYLMINAISTRWAVRVMEEDE